ncbi:MAG TPA: hypothetical protein VMV79_07470 [Alphaproteobacteria bacterium]|nr:hypothetical protein [Alphaproteobacteria bacterium]
MAEDKKAPAPAADKGGKKSGAKKKGAIGLILLMTAFGAATPFILPSLILLAGMFPTVVALFTDTDRRYSSVIAVGSMNAAGIAPFLIELWQKGQTMENALLILQTPKTWVVMLGAAALGQLMVFAVPQAIAIAAIARAETRLRVLHGNLERLKISWGADVATSKPLDQVMKGE